jgi:YjbE family integral membrane protein
MAELLQIIFINLAVSCDNVGVIALATRDLPHKFAVWARRAGVILSVVLKLVFVALAGFLFSVPWLHIRVLGGVILLYVTWSMLRDHKPASAKTETSKGSFLFALLSITAADVSMSLDNVIAILGVVSHGRSIGPREISLVFIGLLICVPFLLFFSEHIAALLTRYTVLSYLCAGYLVYIAIGMILEDETLSFFFKEIHFGFTKPAALLCGLLMIVYGFWSERHRKTTMTRSDKPGLFPLYCAVVLYSWISVVVMAFLENGPILDGRTLSATYVYGFAPSGATAVYMLTTPEWLFSLCAIRLAYIAAEKYSYKRLLWQNISGMLVFAALRMLICTVGMTLTFGFGRMPPYVYLSALVVNVLLLCTDSTVFCLLSVLIRRKALFVIASLFYALAESFAADIVVRLGKWLSF